MISMKDRSPDAGWDGPQDVGVRNPPVWRSLLSIVWATVMMGGMLCYAVLKVVFVCWMVFFAMVAGLRTAGKHRKQT